MLSTSNKIQTVAQINKDLCFVFNCSELSCFGWIEGLLDDNKDFWDSVFKKFEVGVKGLIWMTLYSGRNFPET